MRPGPTLAIYTPLPPPPPPLGRLSGVTHTARKVTEGAETAKENTKGNCARRVVPSRKSYAVPRGQGRSSANHAVKKDFPPKGAGRTIGLPSGDNRHTLQGRHDTRLDNMDTTRPRRCCKGPRARVPGGGGLTMIHLAPFLRTTMGDRRRTGARLRLRRRLISGTGLLRLRIHSTGGDVLHKGSIMAGRAIGPGPRLRDGFLSHLNRWCGHELTVAKV